MEESKSYEDLMEFQRKERKEVIAKTQKLKHGVPKGDKKKKKEVTAEITQILADLDVKHDEELKQFQAQHLLSSNPVVDTELSDKPISAHSNGDNPESSENFCSGSSEKNVQKLSKAQKRRNKKAQQVKDREKAIADQEMDNLSGSRHMESVEMNKKLQERKLTIHEVPSDGNCLYKAIEHQLSILNIKQTTVKELREETAKYLLSHKEDFLPFLTHPETGDVLSDEEFQKYCEDIASTSAWGGHIEIKALSCTTQRPVEIIQAIGPSIIIGEENANPKLIISYHRHMYGLGEHYNSVTPLGQSENTEA